MIKDYLKRNPIRPLEIIIYVVVIIGLSFFLLKNGNQSPRSYKENEIAYNTIHPKISKSFSVQKLIGRVRSNNFAMIHPRREGIIKDILVDIGDTVKAGQTIAYLFPPGVAGESVSQISKAKVQLQSVQRELKNTNIVAEESVKLAEKKLIQTQTSLDNFISRGRLTRSQIVQHYDQAATIGLQVLRNIERMIFGDSSASRTVNSIRGNFNNQLQENKVFDLFQETDRAKERFSELEELEKQGQLYGFLDQVEELLNETEILYRDVNESREHGALLIEKHTKEIQGLQNKILKAQEMIDDTLLTVDQLERELDTARRNFSLTESRAKKSIDLAYNKVEVVQAAYQNALIRDGHVQIPSPFTGKISTKFAEVGHMAMSSKALFEVMEVDTSLGEVAKLEIEFGVPEEFIGSINVGSQISVETSVYGVSKNVQATINRKSSQINLDTNTVMVHAIFNDNIILPHNSNVYVYIEDMKNHVYEIPSSSIKKRRNKNFVFVKDDDEYQKIEVQMLAEDGEYSDVVSDGLSLESNVVVNPSVRLFMKTN